MAKSLFKINAIKRGMERQYRESWIEGKTVSKDGKPLHPAMLADTDMVEAKNYAAAESVARQRFPGRTLEVSRIG